ncbi:MAG: hypothetical protein ACRC2J_00280 [Microcoleaceae cyanobacterium]
MVCGKIPAGRVGTISGVKYSGPLKNPPLQNMDFLRAIALTF